MTSLTLMVDGSPVPQGSKKAYVVNGRAVLVESSKNIKSWRAAITLTARVEANRQGWQQTLGPVSAEIIFRIDKPASARRAFPTVKPDIDKLLRALLDGLTDAGIWKDDSQVVELVAKKVYAMTNPGVTATITTLEEPNNGSKR